MEREKKRVEGACALRNKFAMLSDSAEGQNLSG